MTSFNTILLVKYAKASKFVNHPLNKNLNGSERKALF